ncbi:MAG TPA: cation:proton antiporter [Pseudomonas sp.]|nr:cation:proton antiporter [Pseudomonas sp.]
MTEPLLNGLSWLLLIGGLLFFVAGSIGLLRFPDTVSRLHALTKADTLGLGLVIAGLSLACRQPLGGRADAADLAVVAGLQRHGVPIAGAAGRRGATR